MEQDLPLLLAWRHNQRVMEFFVDGFELWETHIRWFKSLCPGQRESLLILADGRPVGEIHYDAVNREVGIFIGDITLWGKGIAKQALAKLLLALKERGNWSDAFAAVHPANQRSRGFFRSMGFMFVKVKDDGYLLFRKAL